MTIDRETRLLLTAYHDGALSAGEVIAFERRLAAEPELRQALDEIEGLSQSLSAVFSRAPAAPNALRARIQGLAGGAAGSAPSAAVMPVLGRDEVEGNGDGHGGDKSGGTADHRHGNTDRIAAHRGDDDDADDAADEADRAAMATLSAMAAMAAMAGSAKAGTDGGRGLTKRSRPSWMALAASLVVGAVLGALTITAIDGRPSNEDQKARSVLEAVVDGHLRALAAEKPFEIASSDRHVVKPWFNGRTTIAPNAPDLADQGFPLIGGRVDVIDAEPVPSLVYRHDRHVISVTITASPATDGGETNREGTMVESWRDGNLTYWVASDLNAADLRQFSELFRQRASPAP